MRKLFPLDVERWRIILSILDPSSLSLFFFCPGVTLFCSVWTQEYETRPPLHLRHRFAMQSEPSAVCLLLILTAQGLVALPLLFTPFPVSQCPRSVLSFRVRFLSSHPSSQSSFISWISLPEPPQPEMSQSLASFPLTSHCDQALVSVCGAIMVFCSCA